MASQEIKEVCGTDETEMEKMQKRLTETGIYEEGMNFQHMKEMIAVLDESEMMHETSKSQNFDSIIDQESPPPIESPTENNNQKSKPNYANVVKTTPSSENIVPTSIGTEEGTSKMESKSQSCLKESNAKVKLFLSASEKRSLFKKKVTMDPFAEPKKDEVFLEAKREVVIDSKEPSFLWRNDGSVTKELIEKMSEYLEKVRDEWIAENSPIADDSESEWGSPIEVESRNVNLEKKPMTRTETEPTRESLSRASKRKATTLIESINNISDNEFEADDDSALLKKRKPQQETNEPIASGSNMQIDLDADSSSFHTANENKIEESDEDIFEPVNKSKSENIYPRRVSPTHPGTNKAKRGKPRGGKANYRGPRSKKNTENNNKSNDFEKSYTSHKFSAPEIVLDWDDDDEVLHDITPKTDPKMVKMSLAERTRLAEKKIVDLNKQEKQQIEEKKLQEMKSEEAKKKKQEELYKKRFSEAEEKQKMAKSKEEDDLEKKKKWNRVVNKSKKKDNKPLSEEDIRAHLEDDDDVICEDPPAHSSTSSSKNKVICPICNEFFHENDIENHASGCMQFSEIQETSSPVVGKRQRKNNKGDILLCHVCKKFETRDASEYMEHVQICTEEHRRQRDDKPSDNQDDSHSNSLPTRKFFKTRRSRPN